MKPVSASDFSRKRRHAGALKNLQRGQQRRRGQDGRIADLPALRAARSDRSSARKEISSAWLCPHQPAKRGSVEAAAMPLVHEAAADGAGAGIEIFVAAPHGEVGIPVVQVQRHIADRVREIDADGGADAARRRDQGRQDPAPGR